ncbi:MAG TPA: bifunctional acetate--CoA ligase family protein/GNAT family N-acetyltransferase [Burkholderiales bacterium]|nr:bifunctional acetate--CoA ligase family protein/GNAT family N-acetyltransferase [Burkholderiales bacterium]
MKDVSGRHYLTPLFEPRSVAIVGASETPGKVGTVLLSNMLAAGYRGPLFAVNPKYSAVGGVPCYASVGKIPADVDLAVIATPARTVPQVIEECGKAGVRSAVVITAGFSEVGAAGAKLERALLENARRGGVRLVGPNCLGIARPALGLNATFARGAALPGSLGLVSQSGAVCAAMLDWATPNKVGFSSIVSLGGSSDIDFGEIIDYLANDQATEHILLYIEGIRDARRFLSSLRAAARAKPVIVMKVGRHPAGSRAAVSHTGAIVGSDDVFEAAVERAGVVRVASVGQLVAAAQALASHVRPKGEQLAVITNGGGPGVMAADRLADLGLSLADLAPATVKALHAALPANWSHGNPIDLIGDADSARYKAAVSACLADGGIDGILVILTPQAMTEAEATARAVIEAAAGASKPLIACWMGEASAGPARKLLHDASIPVFRTPDPAVEMFAHLAAYYRNQRTLLQAPGPVAHLAAPDIPGARLVIDSALAERRKLLSETESKALLAAFHIPIAQTVLAHSARDAMLMAQEMGFPVAMKIDSPDIAHKSDVGGVRLNLVDAESVRSGYREMLDEVAGKRPDARLNGVTVEPMVARPHGRELVVGVIRDSVFGPAITVGMGGRAVEVVRDRAVALPPLNAFLVKAMIGRTRVSRLLGEFRRMPAADMQALESVLLRVSEMVCELPQIEEFEINPLIADETGAVAVDARAVVRDPQPMRGRYAHMAIHPYPSDLVASWVLPEGSVVQTRPIRPEDAEMEQEFVRNLSDKSRYFRFMNSVRELTPSMLTRFTQIDYDREMAFVCVRSEQGREEEIAVGRYVTNPDGRTCEFAVVVADAWQQKGLGRRLLETLISVARSRGLEVMVGHILAANEPMLSLCTKLGFRISDHPEDSTVRRAILDLASPRSIA